MTMRESDQSIVLGDGNAAHRGKGLTGRRSPHRTHSSALESRRKTSANLPGGNSLLQPSAELRKRVCLKSLVREYRTLGSVRGEGG